MAMEPETLAKMFHESYERQAPAFNYDTRPATAVPWEAVPEPNRSLMVAVAADVLRQLDAVTPARDDIEVTAGSDVLADLVRLVEVLTAERDRLRAVVDAVKDTLIEKDEEWVVDIVRLPLLARVLAALDNQDTDDA